MLYLRLIGESYKNKLPRRYTRPCHLYALVYNDDVNWWIHLNCNDSKLSQLYWFEVKYYARKLLRLNRPNLVRKYQLIHAPVSRHRNLAYNSYFVWTSSTTGCQMSCISFRQRKFKFKESCWGKPLYRAKLHEIRKSVIYQVNPLAGTEQRIYWRSTDYQVLMSQCWA